MCVQARAQGQWYTMGIGTNSCGSFIKALQAEAPSTGTQRASLTWEGKQWVETGYAYEQWLMGFVSAANLSQLTPTKQIMVDGNGIVLWVKHYCDSHADETLISAAGAFVVQQRKKMK